MLKFLPIFLLLSVCLLTVACTPSTAKKEMHEPGALDLILCEEPRSQVCTREYKPVCATSQNGNSQTGSTACTACSDLSVKGYKMGEC